MCQLDLMNKIMSVLFPVASLHKGCTRHLSSKDGGMDQTSPGYGGRRGIDYIGPWSTVDAGTITLTLTPQMTSDAGDGNDIVIYLTTGVAPTDNFYAICMYFVSALPSKEKTVSCYQISLLTGPPAAKT